MSDSEARKRLARGARERAESIRAIVEKYRVDPENYFTTHEQLNGRENEALWYESVARALEEAEEENEDLRLKVGCWQEGVNRVRSSYPKDVFRPGPPYRTKDAESADWARMVCDNVESAMAEIYKVSRDVAVAARPKAREEQG